MMNDFDRRTVELGEHIAPNNLRHCTNDGFSLCQIEDVGHHTDKGVNVMRGE